MPWILGLLVLLLVGWGLTELVDDDIDDVDAYTQVEDVDAMDVDADVDVGQPMNVITVANTITDSADRMSLAGRDVALADMQVTRVVGDQTFFVVPQGQNDAQELLIVLDEQATPNQPGVEGRYDVTAGQVMTIDGELRELAMNPTQEWGISEAEAQGLSDDEIYVHADRLNIQ